mmetsp:Transcript_21416/g.35318  ORF Transcript_21416/g.35318 Transcript_21416/m.35318 type:complete len:368 (-) Transcript_21416:62-1165(-)
MVPLSLLMNYFDQACKQLLKLADDEVEVVPSESTLNWHRSRVVESQLTALADTLVEYDGRFDAKVVQDVLREIGVGNFNNVVGSSEELRKTLVKAMEKTNEVAREAFARSVLFVEMRDGHSERNLRTHADLDRSTLMEYCGLAITAMRLPEIQRFLFDGTRVRENIKSEIFSTPEERLLYIQRLMWKAVGWEPDTASDQIKHLLEGNSELMNDKEVMETIMKYMSSMTVAAANASMGSDLTENMSTDGTTRVVNVTYSEKVVTGETIQSLSAPTSNSMNEHKNEEQSLEQRQQRDVAKMRQDIYDEFMSLSPDEQSKTLTKAKQAQNTFLQQVMNTPPGAERVILMKSIDFETQKLLIIHKMCATSE